MVSKSQFGEILLELSETEQPEYRFGIDNVYDDISRVFFGKGIHSDINHLLQIHAASIISNYLVICILYMINRTRDFFPFQCELSTKLIADKSSSFPRARKVCQ